MKNILEYVERSAERSPDKIFIGEEASAVTYSQFFENVKRIASAFIKENVCEKPVVVLTGKNARCLESAFAAVAAGGFYTVLDNKSPAERLNKILSRLNPSVIITDEENKTLASALKTNAKIFLYENAVKENINETSLRDIRSKQTDSDIAYVLFTSGSTGMPKGAVLTHRAVISYTEWITKEFSFDETTVFGSQSPFYFSMSVTDIFSAACCTARLEIIPKSLFAFPVELINYLNAKKVNTLYWVPTALSIVANIKIFDAVKPQYIKNVLFAGEVMPVKQLNYWVYNLPKEVCFANLFGPTETTDICTFYKLDKHFSAGERIPIGNACDNCKVYVLDENGKEADEGELYVGGAFLSNGYYNDAEKTATAFVQNPLRKEFPETLYRTGDIVRKNENGILEYISRRDFQIKHMGYRIETGEIENSLSACESARSVVCIYDADSDLLVLCFEGKKSTVEELRSLSQKILPRYMQPNEYVRVQNMPQNANGKIDRLALKEYYEKNYTEKF